MQQSRTYKSGAQSSTFEVISHFPFTKNSLHTVDSEEEKERVTESDESGKLQAKREKQQRAEGELNDLEYEDFFSLARHGRFGQLRKALKLGFEVDSRDEHGNTILIIGAQNNNKLICKLALRYGADINAANYRGNTSIHFCSEYQYYGLAQYLLEKGADPRLRNVRGFKATEGISQNKAAFYREVELEEEKEKEEKTEEE